MGSWKKRTPGCNRRDRGSSPLRKQAHFHVVQPSQAGCRVLNAPKGRMLPLGEKCVLEGSTSEVSMEEIIDNDGSASSHLPQDWHAIDWRRVEQQVRTTQMRIAKATQSG